MKKINKLIEKNIKNIILTFIYIQPILDLIAGITQNILKINITLSSIIRLLFLFFCIYYTLILDKTKEKKKNIIYTTLIIIYTIIFSLITLTYKDINALSYELKNTINTFYLPIILLAIINMFKQYNIKIKLKDIIYIYMTYIVLILIPNLTHTGFQSYAIAKVGSSGWFTSANSIGNILSILLPFIILFIIKNKKTILILLPILYVFLSMGTKVPILSFIICVITTLLFYIIKWIKEKQNKQILITSLAAIIISITSIIVIPKTTFYKNIQIHKEYLGFKNYTEILTNYKLLDHFVFSQRLTFLKNTQKNYEKSNILQKTFGIGYIENYGTEEISTKTIEIDYFEILYRNGIIGFIIYFSILIPAIKNKIKQAKEKTIENIELKTSILIILLLSLFSGHVLVTPAVSIFVALIIGGKYEKINQR